MRFLPILCTFALAGCPWVGKTDLDERLDADGDGEVAIELGGTDCNDEDPEVGQSAEERCNEADDDCDGVVDEGLGMVDGLPFYADLDGDGVGNESDTVMACVAPNGHVAVAGDCDDVDDSRAPGLPELCDGVDNDCDGEVDGDEAIGGPQRYRDADGDGFGDPLDATASCVPLDGRVDNADDCDDLDASRNPGTRWFVDSDGDGFGTDEVAATQCEPASQASLLLGDCDDSDAEVHPEAEERCGGDDEDCDGLVDDADAGVVGRSTWYPDEDGDGFAADAAPAVLACAAPAEHTSERGDCDDSNPSLHPNTPWFIDLDQDGFGLGLAALSCVSPAGAASVAGDCNDANASISPDAIEVCDGLDTDEDCDGLADDDDPTATGQTTYWLDWDFDFRGDPDVEVPLCDYVQGVAIAPDDCDDSTSSIGGPSSAYDDIDGDGWGGQSLGTFCEPPSQSLSVGGDCNDIDASIHPEAAEVCDGVDSDCDGTDDDPNATGLLVWYDDDDGDGFGDPDQTKEACEQPDGYQSIAFDCDDQDPTVYFGAAETCYDGVDADCMEDDDYDCDGDGYAAIGWGEDCDDTDPSINPLQPADYAVPDDFPTIQEAIDGACEGSIVTVAAGVYPETLVLDRDLTLRGDGPGATIIDGGALGTVVEHTAGWMQSLTIRNGASDYGGCVDAQGADGAGLDDVELDNCHATERGGALRATGSYSVLSGDIHDSSAEVSGGCVHAFDMDDLTMLATRLEGCTSEDDAAGMMILSSVVNLSDVQVVGSSAVGTTGGVHLGESSGQVVDLLIADTIADSEGAFTLVQGGRDAPLHIDGLRVERSIATSATGTSAGSVLSAIDLTITDLVVLDTEMGAPGFGTTSLMLDLAAAGSLTVERMLFAGNDGGVFVASDGSAIECVVDQATLVGNGNGLATSRPVASAPLQITNTISAYNGNYGLASFAGFDAGFANIVLWGNAQGWFGMADPGALEVDPSFVSAGPALDGAEFDLRLAPGSAAMGTGSVDDPGYWGGALSPLDAYDDLDGDGMYDSWELRFGLDVTLDDAGSDADADGLPNGGEFDQGSWPTLADTDGDGVNDAAESLAGTNPLDASSL